MRISKVSENNKHMQQAKKAIHLSCNETWIPNVVKKHINSIPITEI